MLIDYHSHLGWDWKTNTYQTRELLEDMEKNGIDVRLVSALQGYSIEEQNHVVAGLAEEHPGKILACAVINPKERDCVSYMQRIAESGKFKAIELDSLEHCYYPEVCPHMDEIMDIAAEYRLPVNCFTGWGPRTMPAQWTHYAKKNPKLKMVLLHMGTTDFGYGCVNLVGQFENVWVETSCMYELPILRKAFRQIPKERFLFGSHFPHKFTRCSIDTFELLELSEEVRQGLFFENAKNILGLESEGKI